MTFLTLSSVLDEAIDIISETLGEEIRVIPKYPSSPKAFPLDKVTVSVAVSKTARKNGLIGDTFPKSVEAEIEIGVFVPLSSDSSSAYDILENASCALEQSDFFHTTEAIFSSLGSSRTTNAYELFGKVKALFFETDDVSGENTSEETEV